MSYPSPVSASTGAPVAEGARRFSCTLRHSGRDVAWIRVAGELDIATSPLLEAALRAAEPQLRRVVLDLRQVSFLDTHGVHVMAQASHELRQAGRRLVLVRGPAHVDRMFEWTHSSDALDIIDLNPGEPPVLALLKLARRERMA